MGPAKSRRPASRSHYWIDDRGRPHARVGDDWLQSCRHSGVATVEIGSEQAESRQAVLLGDAARSCIVATWTGQIRLLGVRSTTADEESSGDLRFIHHGLSPSCRERMAVTVTRPPTCARIHASVGSVRPGPL